jgi:phage regulator Rha-like protein
MEISISKIEKSIYTIRGFQVMLDSDLAEMYQTETKYINRAVNRNPSRFPEAFAFELTQDEWTNLKFQIGTSSAQHGGRRKLPTVFTEQGVSMLSAVLNTEVAILVSIQIIQAFVAMRKTLGQLQGVIQRLEGVEIKQLQTDNKLEQVLKALEKNQPAKQGIFYEGQLFDAHVFACDLIKQANNTRPLI